MQDVCVRERTSGCVACAWGWGWQGVVFRPVVHRPARWYQWCEEVAALHDICEAAPSMYACRDVAAVQGAGYDCWSSFICTVGCQLIVAITCTSRCCCCCHRCCHNHHHSPNTPLQCMESQYINSRPFRVNAGPVHAYVQASHGKTAYLSELCSGSEVLVADAAGRARTAIVGRCKVEVRPMVRCWQWHGK